MEKTNTRRLVFCSMLAAVYFALTYALAPLSYGMMQLRVSEALTIMPLFMWESVPALFVGCLLANMLGPNGLLDIVVGSLCTLSACALTYALRRRHPAIALLPQVLCNAVGVGVVISVVTGMSFWLCAMWVGAGQAGAVYGIGLPLYYVFRRTQILNKVLTM